MDGEWWDEWGGYVCQKQALKMGGTKERLTELHCMEVDNPHGWLFPPMKLYLEEEVEELAQEIWVDKHNAKLKKQREWERKQRELDRREEQRLVKRMLALDTRLAKAKKKHGIDPRQVPQRFHEHVFGDWATADLMTPNTGITMVRRRLEVLDQVRALSSSPLFESKLLDAELSPRGADVMLLMFLMGDRPELQPGHHPDLLRSASPGRASTAALGIPWASTSRGSDVRCVAAGHVCSCM